MIEKTEIDICDNNLYDRANDKLRQAYIDLLQGDYNFIDNPSTIQDLIHIVRTYDNMRRRKVLTNILQYTKM